MVRGEASSSEDRAPAAQTGPPARADGDDDLAPSDDLVEARRQGWARTADRLANTEQTVYETVPDADGVLAQSGIVERTDLSKATVSRALDSLETGDLVERKRRGTGNTVPPVVGANAFRKRFPSPSQRDSETGT